MRIWDVNPGYLNRQSLLGEHRELHGIVSIIVNGKKGYSKHPETLRWRGYGWAIRQRHRQLACEMQLRGFIEKSPVATRSESGAWPSTYLDEPAEQFQLLKAKYLNKEEGRIPLPKNSKQLWNHHKYSVLARDGVVYREMGRNITDKIVDFSELAQLFTELLRTPPSMIGIKEALQHMWKHVSASPPGLQGTIESRTLRRCLKELQRRSVTHQVPQLTSATALGELMAWIPNA